MQPEHQSQYIILGDTEISSAIRQKKTTHTQTHNTDTHKTHADSPGVQYYKKNTSEPRL